MYHFMNFSAYNNTLYSTFVEILQKYDFRNAKNGPKRLLASYLPSHGHGNMTGQWARGPIQGSEYCDHSLVVACDS